MSNAAQLPDRYLPVDDEGYFMFDGRRVDDDALGQTLLKNLRMDEEGHLLTSMQGNDAFVEAFDAPLIARHVRLSADGRSGEIDLPYHLTAHFSFATLCVDEWDRFHGLTGAKIPFVFSRHAQVEFFDLLDSFDDESVTIKGKRFEVGPWLLPNQDTSKAQYWSEAYVSGNTRFDQGGPAQPLPIVLPQLKLSKSRILVMGSGFGHDAAYLAQQGHSVTGIDFSSEAVAHAKAKYGSIENLSFLQKDVFDLPSEWAGRFDMIFEHTLYCAVTPERRNELVKVWDRLLNPSGFLLGIFFVNERRLGPPWGGSEWELRERLNKYFQFMFWTRWRQSIGRRRGQELVMYARKRG